jgi:hypothetical protein
MKILFAGIPGIRKSTALHNLAGTINSDPKSKRAFLVDGEIPLLDQQLYGADPLTFLNLTPRGRKERWRIAFQQLRRQFEHAGNEHHMLGLHLIYRHNQIPHSSVEFSSLIDWKPDAIVTFIDDAYLIRERIHRGGYPSFSLNELLLWRAEEVLVGDLLARTIDPGDPPPNLVLSVKHPTNQLARFIADPRGTPRIYTSYSITDTRGHADRRAVLDAFRMRLYQLTNVLAFDPLTIDELPPLFLARDAQEGVATLEYDPREFGHRWPRCEWPAGIVSLADDSDLASDYPLRLPMAELRDVSTAMDAQVSDRDYRLVDQAHYLVVYRPTIAGTPILSQGVQAEVSHAQHTGCPVIWFIKEGDPLPKSPFVPKNPKADPNFFHDKTEDRFWARLASLEPRRDRDSFLL